MVVTTDPQPLCPDLKWTPRSLRMLNTLYEKNEVTPNIISFDMYTKTNVLFSQAIYSLLGKLLEFGDNVEFNMIGQRRLGSRRLSRELFYFFVFSFKTKHR